MQFSEVAKYTDSSDAAVERFWAQLVSDYDSLPKRRQIAVKCTPDRYQLQSIVQWHGIHGLGGRTTRLYIKERF